MKAIRIHEFGETEVLTEEDVSTPEPGSDEIRIRVIAAGVNPADWKMRKGLIRVPLPITMGLDVAGVVDAVGSKVKDFRPGDEVFAKARPPHGAYAEYTVVKASAAALKPRRISFAEAAAVPTAALTAWQALFDTAGLDRGQTVLIHAAAGGVGSFAAQFAKWKGARVIGTASHEHADFVKSLGADEIIDYRAQRFEEVVRDVDVVLDTIGGDTLERSWQVLRTGGRLVTLVGTVPEDAGEQYGVHAHAIVTRSDGSELAQIAKLIDEGHIKPVMTEELPLSEARRAHELSESRHATGKIVLRVAEEPSQQEIRHAA